jgi:hypothetical protein
MGARMKMINTIAAIMLLAEFKYKAFALFAA